MHSYNNLETARLKLNWQEINNLYEIEYKKQAVGKILLTEINSNTYELKFELQEIFSGYGFMTEALKELIRYLFLEESVECFKCLTDNHKALRVLEKNGFIFKDNIYSLTKEDYINTLEKVQLFDTNFNPTDKWIYRGELVPEGYLRGVVDIVIKNTKYNRYLMTRRDRNKKTYPGKLETTGGSICYGETIYEAAKREVLEETGISDIRLTYLYSIDKIEKGVIFFEFYGETECELDSIILQPEETEHYAWLEKIEYLNLWNSNLTIKSQRDRVRKILESI